MTSALIRTPNTSNGRCQLARSLERILEEANRSGELQLSNRKLRDFPKSVTNYHLSDTVVADLSRNRFSELPEDVTTFAFLETLILYHNTIRSIPNAIKCLTSLTYLDLRSNQLNILPREICFLPIRVLLLANNRLVSLPDELGRMENLTDLDVSCNQLTSLPTRVGDLRNLRSLSVRSNNLTYIPKEISSLLLVSLNLANNRITGLPPEIRFMTSLNELNVENNPLTSPPASLCVRGLVHILKYLESQSMKEDKLKYGFDGNTTLKRPQKLVNNPPEKYEDGSTSSSSRPILKADIGINNMSQKIFSNGLIDITPTMDDVNIIPLQQVTNGQCIENNFTNQRQFYNNSNQNENGNIVSSLCDNLLNDEDMLLKNLKIKDNSNKQLDHVQTYREYKEALKQQRNNETYAAAYRQKGHNNTEANSMGAKVHYNNSNKHLNGCPSNDKTSQDLLIYSETGQDTYYENKPQTPKLSVASHIAFNENTKNYNSDTCTSYLKPKCPMPVLSGSSNKITQGMPGKALPVQPQKLIRNKSWNYDIPVDKLTFTMRREFDKQKEEIELTTQLRTIIETRLKMELPEDIASALTDGVILCHLANFVLPRSVASIHVPSPGVPKLTMARCRRNVDNFLEACRKIGVDEEFMCSCSDVVSYEDSSDPAIGYIPNTKALLTTVNKLISLYEHHQQYQDKEVPATNANRTDGQLLLSNDLDKNWETTITTTSTTTSTSTTAPTTTTTTMTTENPSSINIVESNNSDTINNQIINVKRLVFYDNGINKYLDNKVISKTDYFQKITSNFNSKKLNNNEQETETNNSFILSMFLSLTFIITFLLLTIFPLPN